MRGAKHWAARLAAWSALAVALAPLPACGARWTEGQQRELAARSRGSAEVAVADGATAQDLGPGTATGIASAPGVVTGPDGPAPPAGSPTQAAGPLPCAAPSTAPGVTESTIALGAVNSLTGPVAGLGATALAATQAYVAYRNATGGVCGRQLVLRAVDDGADGGRNRTIVNNLKSGVLGFVGGIAGGDDGGAEVIAAERIPFIGNSISGTLRTATPSYYGVNMPLAEDKQVLGKFRYLQDQGVRRAAVVYSSPAISEAAAQMELMRAAGLEIVLDKPLPITTLSYDSAARSVANSGADYLLFVHEQGASAAMARALSDIGYRVRFPEYIVAYGSNFLSLAGAAGEGATSWLYTLPIEDAGTNPELDAFLEWMERTAPTATLDTFASVAWAAAKAFVDTLTAIDAPISREALLDQAAATASFDAGGMVGRVRFSAKVSEGCLVGVVVRDAAWQRLTPAQGFLC